MLNNPLFLVPSGNPCEHKLCKQGGPSAMTLLDVCLAILSISITTCLVYNDKNSWYVEFVPSSLTAHLEVFL